LEQVNIALIDFRIQVREVVDFGDHEVLDELLQGVVDLDGVIFIVLVREGQGIRESITQFPIITTGDTSSALLLTNQSLSNNSFNFAIDVSSNVAVSIQFNTNLGPPSSPWQTLFATTGGPGQIDVTVPMSATNKSVFYRAELLP